MPDFEYKLTNGKTLVLSGDTHPDDSEVEKIAKEQGVQLALAEDPVIPESKAPVAPTRLNIPAGLDTLSTDVHEPDTFWGGFSKSIKDQILGATAGNEMLQGAAHPQTASDFLGLLIPSEAPPISKLFGRGKLAEVADAVKSDKVPVGEGITPSKLPPDLVPVGEESAFNAAREQPVAPVSDPFDNISERLRAKGPAGIFDPKTLTGLTKTEADVPSIFADVDKLRNSTSRRSFTFDNATGSFKPTELASEVAPEAKPGFVSLKDAQTPEELASRLKNDKNLYKDSNLRPKTNEELKTVSPEEKQLGDGEPPKPPKTPTIEPVSPDAEPIIKRLNTKEPKQASAISEAWNTSRGLMSVDLPFITSAGLRQGLPLIATKNWFKAWIPSIRSYGSKAFYEADQALLRADDLVKAGVVPVMRADGTQLIRDGRPVFKETPSILSEAGVHLTDVNSLTGREEAIRSDWAEKIPVYGKMVAASNRAYTAFINNLRVSTFRNLYDAMENKNDMVALKQLGDFVSTATGRGPLKIDLGGGKEVLNLEKYAQGASQVLFAPKLIASRMQMLNPLNYIMMEPQVRMEYLKAALRTAGAWTTMAVAGKMAGAEVSLNPTSADFGKIKIGNTRLDPAGGFQQFLVLLSRLGLDESTSTTTGKTSELSKARGPFDPTYGSVINDFISNKLHPNLKYFYDAAYAKKGRPFGVLDRAIEQALPMITGDLLDIAREHPELLPALAPLISAGMGSQTYEKGPSKPKFIPSQYDVTLGSR